MVTANDEEDFGDEDQCPDSPLLIRPLRRNDEDSDQTIGDDDRLRSESPVIGMPAKQSQASHRRSTPPLPLVHAPSQAPLLPTSSAPNWRTDAPVQAAPSRQKIGQGALSAPPANQGAIPLYFQTSAAPLLVLLVTVSAISGGKRRLGGC